MPPWSEEPAIQIPHFAQQNSKNFKKKSFPSPKRYVLDPSEQCGFSLAQQAALFHSIKPLFSNKPVMVVANKMDTVSLEELSEENRALVDQM